MNDENKEEIKLEIENAESFRYMLDKTQEDITASKFMFTDRHSTGMTFRKGMEIVITRNSDASLLILQVGPIRMNLGVEEFLYLNKALQLGLAASIKGTDNVITKEMEATQGKYFTELVENIKIQDISSLYDPAETFLRQEEEKKVQSMQRQETKPSPEADAAEEFEPRQGEPAHAGIKQEDILDEYLADEETYQHDIQDDFSLEEEDDIEYEEELAGTQIDVEEEDEEEDEDDHDNESDDDFLSRMESLENMLTGDFEIKEDEEASIERIEEINKKHGPEAAKEYVASLSQETREELSRKIMEKRNEDKKLESANYPTEEVQPEVQEEV